MTEHPDRIERTLEILLYAPIGVGLFLKDTAPTFVDMFVARGRAEIDRRNESVQQHVTTVRSMGQVAIAFGPPMVRQRVERTVGDARRRAEGLFGSDATDDRDDDALLSSAPPNGDAFSGETPSVEASADTESAAIRFSSAAAPTRDPAPTAAAAPDSGWTTYQPEATAAPAPTPTWGTPTPSPQPSAATSAELPIPGYDALSASQVVERLTGLAPDELNAVHAYETSHRQRRTILGKIEQLAG